MNDVASVHRTTAVSTALLYNVLNPVLMNYTSYYLLPPVSSQHIAWGLDVCPGVVF